MCKRALLITFAFWLSALGLGIKWAANPVLLAPDPNPRSITANATAKLFPIHLAPLRSKESSLLTHTRELDEEEDTKTPITFDYEGWSFREARARLTGFMIFWTVGGILLHVIVSRIFRDTKSAAEKK